MPEPAGSPEPAVAALGLVKRYGDAPVVDGLDLIVPRGSFYGLAGPNGAGKTTTIRMLTGLLRPDGGAVRVDGVDVWPDPVEAKRRIGYVPDAPVLFERLTASEMLDYAGLLRGMAPAVIAQRKADLLRVLDLGAFSQRTIADCSLGTVKRIGIAVALLHSPPVLVLDEPFGSLDPVNEHIVEQLLAQYRDAGGTVIVSSHVMDAVERLCDRVAILDGGRVRAEGSVADLTADRTLQEAFIALVGAAGTGADGLPWLSHSSG